MNKIYITPINDNQPIIYVEPIYRKVNGIYGYLIVADNKVFFIYYDGSQLCSDDISDQYQITTL